MSQFDLRRAHDLIDGFAPNSGFTCRFQFGAHRRREV